MDEPEDPSFSCRRRGRPDVVLSPGTRQQLRPQADRGASVGPNSAMDGVLQVTIPSLNRSRRVLVRFRSSPTVQRREPGKPERCDSIIQAGFRLLVVAEPLLRPSSAHVPS